MYHNITNDIQKTLTKSGNMAILLQISESVLDNIGYLDIFRFLYIRTEFIQI